VTDEKRDRGAEELRRLAEESHDVQAAESALAAAKAQGKKAFGPRQLFEVLLKQGDTVRLLVDAAEPGVVVPDAIAGRHAALHYGQALPKPPRDLAVDEWGVRAMHTFNDGLEQLVAVPWSAVTQVSDMACFVWQDSRKLRSVGEREQARKLPPKFTKAGDAARAKLKSVR